MTEMIGLSPAEKRALLTRLLQEKAAGTKTNHPLSHNQQAVWFQQNFAPASTIYNIGVAGRSHAAVDVDALRRACQALVQRHSMLRTTFAMTANGPIQTIHGYQPVAFETVDAQPWDEATLRAQVTAALLRPYDLSTGPLFRVQLFSRGATDQVLLLAAHHIVVDGLSLGLLADELRTFYRTAVRDTTVTPAQPAQQYTDFVQWQSDLLAGAEGQGQADYWLNQLAGAPSLLNLPTDRPRPAVQSYAGDVVPFQLNQPLAAQLRQLARTERTSLYTLLLAAWQVLLYRYTGQEEILVGSPLAARSRAEFAEVIGFFANPVVLRAQLGGQPAFRTFLHQVRETVLAALEHQDYPFSLLVERLRIVRDTSYSPLYQVDFLLQKTQQPAVQSTPDRVTVQNDPGALVMTGYALPQQVGQFDLVLELFEGGDALSGLLKFNADLFTDATIQRLVHHFQTLLAGIVANPDQPITTLPLLNQAERHQLVVAWNQTAADYPAQSTIAQLFERQAAQTPAAVAVVFDQQQLTYGTLNERANQLARHLRTFGVGPNALVGIYLDRSPEMVIGLLGVLKAGAAYVPLDPLFPADRLTFMLEDSGIQVIVTATALQQATAPWPDPWPELWPEKRTICLDRDWPQIAQQAGDNLPPVAQPHDLAYVIYTSGSTGKPKGVQIEQRNVTNFLAAMRREPGLTADDVLLAVTTLSFDIAVLEILLPLTTGARLVLADRETAADGRALIDLLQQSGATVMQATATTWRMLIDAGWQGDPDLKVLCGGEALPRGLANALLPRCGALWNMYGPTETTVWSAVCRVEPGAGPVAMGGPIANTQFYVVDAQLQPVPVGVYGELLIGGDGLARGYLHRPELTNEKFIADPFASKPGARLYRTGDLVRYRPDGTLEFAGRIDHQVKVRGFRIELGEIETVLTQHPAIHEAVVIAREDTPGDQRLVAYLVLAPGHEVPDTATLRAFVRQPLPDYMVPSAFVVLERLPLTPNNKIDRKALPAPDQSRPALAKDYVAPHTDLEKVITSTMTNVLKLETIGLQDNFFELGGHSLLATQLVARLQDTLLVKVPLRRFFETPTVSGLRNVLLEEPAQRPRVERAAELVLRLSQLSDDQVKQLLSQKSKISTPGVSQ